MPLIPGGCRLHRLRGREIIPRGTQRSGPAAVAHDPRASQFAIEYHQISAVTRLDPAEPAVFAQQSGGIGGGDSGELDNPRRP
jgi:hypothetical protein